MRTIPSAPLRGAVFGPQFDGLLDPAQAFVHPSAVLTDPDLSLSEKRAILAAWASANPAPAAGQPPVSVDDILAALRDLDRHGDTRFDELPGKRQLRPRWRRSLLRGNDRAA